MAGPPPQSRFSAAQREQIAAAPANSRRSLREKFLRDNNGKKFPQQAQQNGGRQPAPKAKARSRASPANPLSQASLTDALLPSLADPFPTRTFRQRTRISTSDSAAAAYKVIENSLLVITPTPCTGASGMANIPDTCAIHFHPLHTAIKLQNYTINNGSLSYIYDWNSLQPTVVNSTVYPGPYRIIDMRFTIRCQAGASSYVQFVFIPITPAESRDLGSNWAAPTTQVLVNNMRSNAFVQNHTLRGGEALEVVLPVAYPGNVGQFSLMRNQAGAIVPGSGDQGTIHAPVAVVLSKVVKGPQDPEIVLTWDIERVIQTVLATGTEGLANETGTTNWSPDEFLKFASNSTINNMLVKTTALGPFVGGGLVAAGVVATRRRRGAGA